MDEFLENTSMSTVMMFFAIMIGMAIVFYVIAKVAKSRQESMDAGCPIQSAKATVVDRQQVPQGGVMFSSLSRIWLVFDLEDGRRMKLFDSPSTDILVGDTGELRWQGSSVVSFSRERQTNGTSGLARRQRQAQEAWTCPKCGCENASGWDTCAGCGKKRPEE